MSEKRKYNQGSLETIDSDDIRRLFMGNAVWWYPREVPYRGIQAEITKARIVGFQHDWRDAGIPDHEVVLWVPSELTEDNKFSLDSHETKVEVCNQMIAEGQIPTEWKITPWAPMHIPNIHLVRSSQVFLTKDDAEHNRIWHIKRYISDQESVLKRAKEALKEAEAALSTSA